MVQIGLFTFSCDFYHSIPTEWCLIERQKWILVSTNSCAEGFLFCRCDRRISQSCTPSNRRALLGHISVCIHLTNTPALWEIHYVLSWQSSKHSRDAFWGFVFTMFTKSLSNPAVRDWKPVSTTAALKAWVLCGGNTHKPRREANLRWQHCGRTSCNIHFHCS